MANLKELTEGEKIIEEFFMEEVIKDSTHKWFTTIKE